MSSNGVKQRKPNGHADSHGVLDEQIHNLAPAKSSSGSPQTVVNLLIGVGGIYASFLTWGILQERITTTNYGTALAPKKFNSPVVVNTVQSIFAALLGYAYLIFTRRSSGGTRDLPIYPTREILLPMLMVALTSSLASPFGYASLKYVDYITFTLAKSCKLLPVMFLHVTLFGRRYPWHKYLVVLLVTAGVAVFTLHHPGTAKKAASKSESSSAVGLALLGVNLLFDGLTNATQDHIYKAFRPYTGQQMMCGLNVMATVLTVTYLMFEPFLAVTDVGAFFGMKAGDGELIRALNFVTAHPGVGWDILGFAACGALGQVFIFYTLSTFGSLLLVTVTVTRKMLTMILSVVWFGHDLSAGQYLGVGLVFGGIGAEAYLGSREKKNKERAAAAAGKRK